MFPMFPITNQRHTGWADLEPCRHCASGTRIRSYFSDLICRQLRSTATAFYRHVAHVVGVCAEKQVGWINTTRIVSSRAVVADAEAMRNRPVCDFPCDAMGDQNRAISASEMSVSEGRLRSGPEPTDGRVSKTLQIFGHAFAIGSRACIAHCNSGAFPGTPARRAIWALRNKRVSAQWTNTFGCEGHRLAYFTAGSR